MKTRKQLLSEMDVLNPDEQFYRRYYSLRREPAALDAFLQSLDWQDVLSRRLIIPELDGTWFPEHMEDALYFESDSLDAVAVTRHNRYTPPFRHRHIFFELVYVLRGAMDTVIGPDTLHLKAGEFCLLAPETSHSVSVMDDDSVVLNILMRRQTFRRIFSDMLKADDPISRFFNQVVWKDGANAYLTIDTRQDPEIRNTVISMLLEYENRQSCYEMILEHQLMILFARLLRSYSDAIRYPRSLKKSSRLCLDMLATIQREYRTITMQELAERYGFTPTYCSRLISRYAEKPFKEIVLDLKLETACQLLESTDAPLRKIALECGFENPEHFARLFHKRMGMTPGTYRIRHANELNLETAETERT